VCACVESARESHLLNRAGVVAEVNLGADEEEGGLGAVMPDLGDPLLFHVLKRRRGHDRVADKEDVCLRVRQGAQAVIVLLSCRVKEAECVGLSTNHHRHRIVVKHLLA
jgi:hypothetical protein